MHNGYVFFMIVETKENYTRYHIKYFDEVITYIYIPEIHRDRSQMRSSLWGGHSDADLC